MSHVLSLEDTNSLNGLVQQDETVLRAFYEKHKAPLQKFILRALPEDDAEEVLQDSFLAFIESLRNFRGHCSLKTFLYSIAKRKIVDTLRRKKIKKILFSYIPPYIVESLAVVFLQDNLDKKYLEKKIENVFNQLPHDYARVLRLKYVEGHKVSEISTKMELSFKAVESLLFRARKAFVTSYSNYDGPHILSDTQEI